jgi:GGDEF domain-containing protein
MPFTDKSDARESIRLPKQLDLPTRPQLEQLFNDAKKNLGALMELPFGDAPEIYSLTVAPHGSSHMWLWTLYRGEGNTTTPDWSIVTSDPEQIHGLITSQFPGGSYKKRTVGTASSIGLQKIKARGRSNKSSDLDMSPKRCILEGDLMETSMPDLLQTIMVGALTGRLDVQRSDSETASLAFVDGAPIHCSVSGTGDDSDERIIELLAWTEGRYFFRPEAPGAARHNTTNRKLELLLIEGTVYSQNNKELAKLGVSLGSVPKRVHAALTEDQFEEIARNGTGYDLDRQKRFYVMIDNESSLEELLNADPLPKSTWVQVVYSLILSGLVKVFKVQSEAEQSITRPLKLDWTRIQAAQRALSNPSTNIMGYSAILLFLRQEYLRQQRFGSHFSVVVLRVRALQQDAAGNATEEGLPDHLLRILLARIERLKREVDLLGHFQLLDFALLLPHTNSKSAKVFADRLAGDILLCAERPEMEKIELKVRMGCAGIPDDCSDLEQLLALAQPHFA